MSIGLRYCFRLFLLIAFVVGIAIDISAQDPSLPPSGNFDLTKWKITLPDQSEVEETELSNGFERANEFYTDPVTGAMVFVCRNDGQTGGSTYPRSELREMLRAGNKSISTQGIGLNNWVFSSSTIENQEASGGIDGVMTATVAVDHVSTTGESNRVGRVIIGQIHASDDEPCRIYYRKLPGNSKGSIYIAHEPTTSSEQWYEMIGSRSSSASDPEDGIALGEKFSYEINVVGNSLTVTIMREGKADVVQQVDMTDSGFADDWMYFKAGNYNQNNSGEPGDYAQVSFFALDVSHSAANNPPSVVLSSPSNGESFVEGQDVLLSATASDDDGVVAKVEFYRDGTKIGEDQTSPYSFTWENVAKGSYELNAVATDDKGSSKTSDAIAITVDSQPTEYSVPYEIPRFQAFLAECKLQAPTSATAATPAEIINGYSSANFFVAEGDKVAFNQTGSSMRTELRNETNWFISDGDRSLHGRLKIVEQTCDQVTVVQIHDDANAGDGPNKPLLRIYRHLTRTPANHLWAAIKTDATGDNTTQYDLGPAPSDYFGFDVRMVDGNMIIVINGEEKVNVDVSFWDFPNYWKAGVYLQDEGEATAYFDDIYEGNGSVVNHDPLVSITSPLNEETFTPNDAITISADALDTDGSITKVEFFQGTTKLGEDTTSPYATTWSDVPVGDFTLTAKAFDDLGATTTSLGVDISVGVTYNLTTSVIGEGTVTANPCAESYTENTSVSLLATPAEGFEFDGWGGDLSGRQNPISITMDADKNVEANFIEAGMYALNTTVSGNGTISVSPSAEKYEEGTEISITASPDTGHRFINWSGDISSAENPLSIIMNSDIEITANFGVILSVDGSNADFKLTAFPNPIDFETNIEYTIAKPSSVGLSILDVAGKEVTALFNRYHQAGTYQLQWTVPDNLLEGIYFLKMSFGDETLTSRIVLKHE